MAKHLIIVESPAKVKTISKFLGSNYVVQASVGHVRDLPKNNLAVDENNGYGQFGCVVNNLKTHSSVVNTNHEMLIS